VKLAKLLLEIRRRAAAAPHDGPRAAALKQAVREMLQIEDDVEFDVGPLDALTPQTVLRMDIGLAADEAAAARALRALIVQPARN